MDKKIEGKVSLDYFVKTAVGESEILVFARETIIEHARDPDYSPLWRDLDDWHRELKAFRALCEILRRKPVRLSSDGVDLTELVKTCMDEHHIRQLIGEMRRSAETKKLDA